MSMTFLRLISLPTRSSVMIWAGSALIFAPLALGLSAAALVTGFLVGAVMLGLGIAGTATGERATIPVSAHAIYDRGLGAGLLLGAIAFGVASQPGAAAIFAGTGLFTLAISSITRYSAAT
jgi:hypothetical protein